ncbi:phospholipase SGR2-like [Tasmannia lanceolata]|uniref:phospholipase SGR2-like n=1 Tax=Tasmannia lanceolata TaxID=3420 RepID=UPI004062F297
MSDTGKNGVEREGNDTVMAGSSHVEEISPDLLRNTPSNIARLEDVIEQSKGRQKYLAQTRSPSDGEDVRWYFCKFPLAENELAASVPRTAIVGKSEYFRFSLRDSLALEASFLQREEELLSGWWREYAECSDGPSGLSRSFSDNKLTELYAIDEERVGVPVKGGLYEVDLAKRHCFPVYWHGENRRVLRGHWFARKNGLDWLPLREDIAEQLEFAYRYQVWHRRKFQPSGLFAAQVDLQGPTQGLHALFTGEDDTWEAWLVADTSGFSHVLGMGGNGVKLRRGFLTSGSFKPTQDELRQEKEEEMDDYCSQVPVRHLVFMVHGIGQRLEKANLVDDVGDFRHITSRLAERHLSSYQRNTQRILFIPCQWRRGLKLSGETTVEKITLDGVRGLRVMLSATVHDVLYYMSPIYCQDIINSVSNQLNRLYMKFIKRNPGYDGKVSIYGHSLGSVLSYDILCHQVSLSSPFPMERVYKEFFRDEESRGDSDQSAQSSYVVNLENKNVITNGEASEASVMPPEGEKSNLETNTMVEGPSKTSGIQSPSKTSGIQSHEEDSHSSFQKPIDFTQSNDISLFEEDNKKPVQGSGYMFSQGGKGLDANTNAKSPAPDGDTETPVGDTSEYINDRDKLINLLREEVSSLKARIAELESSRNSSFLLDSEEDSSHGLHHGDKVDDPTPKHSFRRKLAPDQDDSQKGYTPYIKYTKLEFKVDTFFAVGAPLGVFLALRNIRIGIGKGQEYWQDEGIIEEMPACRQMLNIFHPFDPVAYRVEPLICKEYISRRPVIIPYHKGGRRLHIGFQEFTEDLAARSQAVFSHLNSMRVKMINVFQPRNKNSMQESIEDVQVPEERTYGSIMMQRLTGTENGRVDHVLQDKTFEHAYISAIGSHTSYWRDPDTALFILKHLYNDIPEDPDVDEQPDISDPSKNQGRPAGLIYQKDPIDEDLPLTFSDKELLREFSRKAKRALKNS